MCGRFAVALDPELVADFYELEEVPEGFRARYNVAPSEPVGVVRIERTKSSVRRRLVCVRWGLVPFWADDPRIGYKLINARAETVANKPAFRAAFRYRRALVPASGFYEWQRRGGGRKQPWYVRRNDEQPLTMAAIWERWQDPRGSLLETMAIITVPANEVVRPVHDRMPLVLEQDEFARWLDPEQTKARALEDLLRRPIRAPLERYPVSSRVNRPGVDDPSLIEPLNEERSLFS